MSMNYCLSTAHSTRYHNLTPKSPPMKSITLPNFLEHWLTAEIDILTVAGDKITKDLLKVYTLH